MEVVGNVEDLLTEILLRVPARPLVRFMCVSKHWLSLISDPKFCHRHTLQNPRSSVSAVFPGQKIMSRGSTALSFIPLDNLDQDPRSNHANQNLFGSSPNCNNPLNLVHNLPESIQIILSCNGLFLCRCPFETTSELRPYYVLNPTTNQFSRLIPPAAASGQSCVMFYQALAFEPSRSPHYKLLVFWFASHDPSEFNLDIYSSETKSWRLVDYSDADPDNCFFSLDPYYEYIGGVYCNGAIHWVGLHNRLSYYHLDDERVGHVDKPDRHSGRSEFKLLQESHCGSHLHLIDIYSSRIEVLEMKSDYSDWCLKYCIFDLNRILTTFWPRDEKTYTVLFLTQEETEGDESSSLLIHVPGQVISYNLKTKNSKSFRLTPRQGIDDRKLRVTARNFRYMETLACV